MTWTRGTLTVVGVAAVLVLWGVSGAANWFYATEFYASDIWSRYLMGSASVSADLLKVILLFAVVWAWSDKRYLVSGAGAGLFVIFTAWSVNSAVGFASNSIFKAVEPKLIAATATQLQIKQIEIGQDSLKWLQNQKVIRPSKRRSDKRLAIKDRDATRTSIVATQNAVAKQIKDLKTSSKGNSLTAHPHSELLGQLTELDRKHVLLGLALFFALLIEMGSSLGLFILLNPAPKNEGLNEGKRASPEPLENDDTNVTWFPVNEAGGEAMNEANKGWDNPTLSQNTLLEQWFSENFNLGKEPGIKASIAYEHAIDFIGEDINQAVFFKFMRNVLPKNKVKRLTKGVHYFIEFKEKAAQTTAVAA